MIADSAERIIKAVSDLIGEPFTPSRAQRVGPRDDRFTVQGIIDSLPVQIDVLRREAAQGVQYAATGDIDGWEALLDDVTPAMEAPILVLDRPITGFGSNDEEHISNKLSKGAVIDIIRDEAMDQVETLHWIFRVYRAETGKLPDRAGFAFWMAPIYSGARDRTPLEQLRHEQAMLEAMVDGF